MEIPLPSVILKRPAAVKRLPVDEKGRSEINFIILAKKQEKKTHLSFFVEIWSARILMRQAEPGNVMDDEPAGRILKMIKENEEEVKWTNLSIHR